MQLIRHTRFTYVPRGAHLKGVVDAELVQFGVVGVTETHDREKEAGRR